MKTTATPKSNLRPAQGAGVPGFTLIELLVTISIIGILSAIALPSFRGFVAGQRVKTASFDVMSALTLARSEAIKRNASVVATPASGGWQNGWTVTAADSTVLQRQSAFPAGLTITGAASLTYNSYGRLTATATPFSISSTAGSVTPRCISIDLSGLPSSKTGSC